MIYIYCDEGVGEESIKHLLYTLQKVLPPVLKDKIIKINAEGVISNNWSKDAQLFIMPGGADSPYAKKLNGKGNQNIKKYVQDGGAYLGICAGSYYGSSYVEFDKGGELEVVAERELAFFPGKAIGPILAKYNYEDNSGALAANVVIRLHDEKIDFIGCFYYNGGGYFELKKESGENVSVVGYYQNHLPAIIHISFEKGNVILSGVHFEYDPNLLNLSDKYLNNIFPDLKKSDSIRLAFITEIFKTLGL
jgi:glutamine amidotransferase-like uncharacterized protein